MKIYPTICSSNIPGNKLRRSACSAHALCTSIVPKVAWRRRSLTWESAITSVVFKARRTVLRWPIRSGSEGTYHDHCLPYCSRKLYVYWGGPFLLIQPQVQGRRRYQSGPTADIAFTATITESYWMEVRPNTYTHDMQGETHAYQPQGTQCPALTLATNTEHI